MIEPNIDRYRGRFLIFIASLLASTSALADIVGVDEAIANYWGRFIVGFCRVEFLCWHSEPNWLGWGVIGVGGLLAALLTLILFLFTLAMTAGK